MPVKRNKLPSPPPNLVWKIRRRSDGLFSNGTGSRPSFGKTGKSFPSHGQLINHIKMVEKYMKAAEKDKWWGKAYPYPYDGCEIVQFRVIEEVSIRIEDYGK